MRQKRSITDFLDWPTVLLMLLLAVLGWLNIYAAVFNEDHQSIFDLTQRYGKQLVFIGVAFIAALVVLILDETFYFNVAYIIYAVALLLVTAVIFSGSTVKGATSWFSIGGFAFQPAEVAKFATSLALARYLSTRDMDFSKLRPKLIASLIIGLPIIFILLQNDTGSALVFISLVFVLYREGLSGSFLVIGFAAALIFILTLIMQVKTYSLFGWQVEGEHFLMGLTLLLSALATYATRKTKYAWMATVGSAIVAIVLIFSVEFIFNDVLEPHQSKRINVLLGLESDPKGAGYNVNQSMIAIGSGGFAGKGFLNGTQTKYDFVPEQSTDFIFCTIGEEWGFLGSSAVIILFILLFVRILIVAERQKSKFSRIYGYGVASILFFHFAVNVGMTIGLAPVIGIPLPFFSYGGSSLIGFTVLIMIFLRMDSDRMVRL